MADQLLSTAPHQLGSLPEFLTWAWRKAIGALFIIGSISFSSTDRQTELQRPHALEQGLEAAAGVAAEAAVELQPSSSHAPTIDLVAADDRAVSASSGDSEGRAGRGRSPTAAAEKARASNTSNLKTIGVLAMPMLACIGIYSTIHAEEQLQHLHPSLYFPLLTFLASGSCASLYSVFYALGNPTTGDGRGGGGEERELVKRKWLKVALTCTGLAASFRVALSLIN